MDFSNLIDSSQVFIIAEAGSNWKCGTFDKDLEQAKKLIEIASNAGANAVKFQTYTADKVYSKNAGTSSYLKKQGIDKKINDLFEDFSMPHEMIPELANFCKQQNILFMSTPFSISDAIAIDPFVEIHKIASFEINHVRLLEFLSKTKKPIIISTGASTFEEIDFAVSTIKQCGNNKIALLQCTSKYPCPIDSLNLSVIPQMKQKYGLPVGFSDHSLDPLIGPLMSVGLGSIIIEKHFTLDKFLSGPDHSFALDPSELELMVKSIRNAKKSLGSGKKEILKVEEELQKFAIRHLQAITNIVKGDILEEGKNFDVLRPGNRKRGIPARFLSEINGKKATKDIQIGDGVTEYE
jgi:N,N'-diacetyllegionaminate synthase